MSKTSINSSSWTYCQYVQGDLRALITIGASADILDDSFTYFSTVLDDENSEVFQKEFSSLDKACLYINERYQDEWDFVDSSKPTIDAGGCSTCIAH